MVTPYRISSPGERDGGSRLPGVGLGRKSTGDRRIIPVLRQVGLGLPRALSEKPSTCSGRNQFQGTSADNYRRIRGIAKPERGFADADTVEDAVRVHVEDPESRAENPDGGFYQAAPISSHGQVARLSKKCGLIDASGPDAVATQIQIPARRWRESIWAASDTGCARRGWGEAVEK